MIELIAIMKVSHGAMEMIDLTKSIMKTIFLLLKGNFERNNIIDSSINGTNNSINGIIFYFNFILYFGISLHYIYLI